MARAATSHARAARDPARGPRGRRKERGERAFTKLVSLDVEVDADGCTAAVDFDVEGAGGSEPGVGLEGLLRAGHVEAVEGLEPVAILQTQRAEQRVGSDAE